jgi:hypothetical protein
MTQSNIRVDDKAVKRALKGIRIAAEDVRSGWREFQQYMRVKTDQTFERNAKGGSYRGVTWKYFRPQYTRKDGTVIPAWGGVRKVRGRGLVKGRLRPSRTRVKQGDSIMQDTKTMRGRAALVQRMDRDELVLGQAGSLKYAKHQQKMRPFLFFQTPRDLDQLTEIMIDHIRRGARNRGGQ